MRPYWKISNKWLTKLSQAGWEMPDFLLPKEDMAEDDYIWIFTKLFGDCADEAYIGTIKSHNNGLTHGRTTWTVEDFQDGEERDYDNLADGLADVWIRNQDEEESA